MITKDPGDYPMLETDNAVMSFSGIEHHTDDFDLIAREIDGDATVDVRQEEFPFRPGSDRQHMLPLYTHGVGGAVEIQSVDGPITLTYDPVDDAYPEGGFHQHLAVYSLAGRMVSAEALRKSWPNGLYIIKDATGTFSYSLRFHQWR